LVEQSEIAENHRVISSYMGNFSLVGRYFYGLYAGPFRICEWPISASTQRLVLAPGQYPDAGFNPQCPRLNLGMS
jgi:hypothetical protein